MILWSRLQRGRGRWSLPGTTCTKCWQLCWGERGGAKSHRSVAVHHGVESCEPLVELPIVHAPCSQDLPTGYAGWPSQLFAIITAVFGLASFALVLALIEQVWV